MSVSDNACERARAHPGRVVWLEPSSDALAHLELLCGYDADLRANANRVTNRLRALLVAHWPALERAFGERLASRGGLAVVRQYPSGPAIQDAGVEQLTAVLKAQRVRRPEAFAKHLHQAALAQTVTITGSATAARLISELAVQLAAVLARRDELEKEIEEGFFALPEAAILRSLPGIGPRLGARIAVEIGSISRFRTPGSLRRTGTDTLEIGHFYQRESAEPIRQPPAQERVVPGCLRQSEASALAYLLRSQARSGKAPQSGRALLGSAPSRRAARDA